MRTVPQIPVDELRSRLDEQSDLQIVDVRRPAEYATGHLPGAVNAELADLEDRAGNFDQWRRTVVACAGGYRSSHPVEVGSVALSGKN